MTIYKCLKIDLKEEIDNNKKVVSALVDSWRRNNNFEQTYVKLCENKRLKIYHKKLQN